MKRKCFTLFGILGLMGCNLQDAKIDQRLKDRVGQEAEQTQQKEKEAREKLVGEMEIDLERRQRLYQSLKGEFIGEFIVDSEPYVVSAEFIPTVYPFDSKSRVRTPEEVNDDLLKLAFDVKVAVRDAPTNALLVNCHQDSIKINLDSGTMSWLSDSSSCSNFFALTLVGDANDLGSKSTAEAQDQAKFTAAEILSGTRSDIKRIVLRMRPSNSGEVFTFVLQRVEL